MEPRRKINEVAKMFDVSVPTLHYWEQEGLFNIDRNEDNQYRQFELSDLLLIWEIRMYRDLDISIKEIRRLLDGGLDVQMETYHRQEKLISEKIKQLKFVQQEVKKQVRCGDLAMALDRQGIAAGKPDIKYFLGTPATMEYSLTYPNNIGKMIIPGKQGDVFIHGVCLDKAEQMKEIDLIPPQARGEHEFTEPLAVDENKEYMEFLFRININDPEDNNLKEVRSQLKKQKLRTGNTYARYLLMGGSLPDRYEYYHAWIEASS